MLDEDAPLLEELILTSLMGDSCMLLPPSFLKSHTPSLKILTLKGFYLPCDSAILRGLESLDISTFLPTHNEVLSTPFNPTIDELIEILGSSTNFRELSLLAVRGSRMHMDRDSRHLDKIDLPHLVTLDISSIDSTTCETLPNHISFSAKANFMFGLHYTDAVGSSCTLSVLKRIGNHKRCISLDLYLIGCDTGGMATTTYELTPMGKTKEGKSALSVRKTKGDGSSLDAEEMDFGELASMMESLIRNSFWKDTTHLKLFMSTQYTFDVNRWRTISEPFKSVEELWIFPQADDPALLEQAVILENTLLSALTPQQEFTAEDPTFQKSQNMVLPRLKRFFFVASSVAHISEQLLDCLRDRKKLDSQVHDLAISIDGEDCEYNDDWYVEVSQNVGRISHIGHPSGGEIFASDISNL